MKPRFKVGDILIFKKYDDMPVALRQIVEVTDSSYAYRLIGSEYLWVEPFEYIDNSYELDIFSLNQKILKEAMGIK